MPVISRIAVAAARGYGMFRSAAAAVTDAYFKYVTLLLPGNGTNGAQNNTFLDSSTNNFTITRNGNTTQGTFAPYGANWSNYFDGSGDYLTVGSNAALGMGTGDFTVELWFYYTATPSNEFLFDFRYASGSLLAAAAGTFGVDVYVGAGNRSGGTVTVNNWYHLAVTRSGSTCYVFLNGAQVGATFSDSTNLATGGVSIASRFNVPTQVFPGYISNFRVVKGTAIYTSAFTPSTTPLTAISGTSLLTCQSNRFIDNSTNNFTITRNGDVSVQVFSPFSPTAAYSASTIGGSGYFDGSGDYLNGPSTGQFAPTGDFTISMWYYPTSTRLYQQLIGNYNASASTVWIVEVNNGTAVNFYTNGTSVRISGSGVVVNAWNYIVLARSGSTITGYVNGVSVGTYTQSGTFGSATQAISIGRGGSLTGSSDFCLGYLADVKLIDGSVVTSIPTAPQTATSGTSLLLSCTNAGVIDNAMMNDLETVGNAQISTTQSKWGGGSLAFDGAGDYLYLPSRATTSFVGDFTVEFWAYRNSGPFRGFTIGDDSGSTGLSVYYSSGSAVWIVYNTNATRISGGSSTASAWQHIAVVRSSGVVKLYVDGTNVGSSWASTGTFSGNIYVGAEFNSGTAYADTNGYIDDLRMTNGYARYTSNFTAPTGPFPTK